MRGFRLFLLAAFASLIVGCGGGGGGGGSVTPSPFTGVWTGTWDSPATEESGTASITVGNSGNFTGTVHSDTFGDDGTVTGHISNNGAVSGTSQYPGQPKVSLSGTWSLNGSGHIVGNVTQSFGGDTFPLSFDLAPGD